MRCSKFSKFMSMDQPPTGQRTNHDLWKSLFHSMQECKRQGLDMRVLKVTSHQADSLAEHVWLGLTVEVQRTWEVLEKELVVRYRACQELHRLFIAIGRKAITYKHANCLERCNQVGGGRFPPPEVVEPSFHIIPEAWEEKYIPWDLHSKSLESGHEKLQQLGPQDRRG